MKRSLDKSDNPIITIDTWKRMIAQSAYQITVTLVLHFARDRIFGFVTTSDQRDLQLRTLIFNQYVFSQIFNMINVRYLDRGLNILRSPSRNYLIWVILLAIVIAQILIVNYGGAFFQIAPIDQSLWLVSIMIGAGSFPVGALLRLMLNRPLERKANLCLALVNPNPRVGHRWPFPGMPMTMELSILTSMITSKWASVQ